MIRHGALLLSTLAFTGCMQEEGATGDIVEAAARLPLLDGLYDQRFEACGDRNSLTRLDIRGDDFQFYESHCLYARQGGQPGAAQGTLICMSEGRRFRRDIEIEADETGLRILDANAARDYTRCPTDA